MAIPISTWALIAGVGAAGVTAFVVLSPTLSRQAPPAVLWLAAWATLFVMQAAWWTLRRKPQRS